VKFSALIENSPEFFLDYVAIYLVLPKECYEAVLKLLLKFPADFQAMLLLFALQQSWHKLGRSPPHVQFFSQNSLECTTP
jgi:hypothetical protein